MAIKVDLNSTLEIVVTVKGGWFTATLNANDTLLDTASATDEKTTMVRFPEEGEYTLDLTARDYGEEQFNVDFVLKAQKENAEETLIAPHTWKGTGSPGDPPGYGKTFKFSVAKAVEEAEEAEEPVEGDG
ncbi:hypothetical protein ACFL41_01830 [Gemmatimonadota bacterium]